ncbi:hypothetical protein [Streptomyces resistomycificus]|uniref:Extensin n=1 Tax=Streptomyces resistomycificus TaxID=67356 RepID=A0A0L8L1H8_9ACTN|nr:hypothetical protein [Streptomyces resistomycificus]KOG31916.1 hypothetical protein ADK37_29520 [Streptomyces resistomycificus]
MADEQYRWLDRETAERLLRGESLEAVDAADRDRAERLAKTLGALSADPPRAGAELPGEAAALAAFRKARTDRVDDWVGDLAADGADEDAGARTALGDRSRGRSSDAGLVRIGGPDPDGPRPRRARPLRLGLVAALAVGMVGGVAVAAGSGALPFGEAEPDPAASVSAAVTSERPFVTPSPQDPQEKTTPDGATGDTGQDSRDTAGGGSASPDDGTGKGTEGREDRPGGTWHGAASACRAVRDGRQLSTDRRRSLEGAAGGSTKVWKYCQGVLARGASDEDARSGGEGGKSGRGDNEVKDDQEDRDGRNDRDDRDGRGSGRGDDGGREDGDGRGDASSGGNGHHANGDLAGPTASPAPDPTYSAL